MTRGIGKIKRLDDLPQGAHESFYKKLLKLFLKLLLIVILIAFVLIIIVTLDNYKSAKESKKRNSYINQMQQMQESLSQARNNRKDNIDFFNTNRTRINETLKKAKKMGYDISELDIMKHEKPEEFIKKIEKDYEEYNKNNPDSSNKSDISSDVNTNTRSEPIDSVEVTDINGVKWLDYFDDKFSILIPDKNYCNVRKDVDSNSLILELFDYNASIEISAFSLGEVSLNSKEEYLKTRTSAGNSKIDKKMSVRGADEAYLISESSLDFKGKAAIAFKNDNVFTVSYSIFGKEQNNQDVINWVEQYFNYMMKSMSIK